MSTSRKFLLTVSAMIALSACKHDQPNVIYMPDMVYSPALKAQEPGSMRMPVAGTVPRDYQPYSYRDVEVAGRELSNPLIRSKTVLARGQAVFNTYCAVCHGPNGEGDGTVVPRFPRPPTLQSDKIRQYPDGSVYHVITMGQNLMPSYASQIAPQDRWAIIHYLRALQRAKHPTPEDLKAAENQ
jgi:mono/diheme cytochrome c family protein